MISARSPWAKKRKSLIVEDLRRLEVPKIESRHADYAAGFPAHFHSNHLGLTSPPWLEVNQHEVKKRLVLEGFGFAILTRHTVESEVESGELIRIRSDRKLKSPIYTAWKKGRVLDRASEEFILRFVEKNQSTIRSR